MSFAFSKLPVYICSKLTTRILEMKKLNFSKPLVFFLLIINSVQSIAQADNFRAAEVKVCFNERLQIWDGFGLNYVETAQTFNYEKFRQDYGGLSLLNESSKNDVFELLFGEDGIQPAIIKMFLDPLHQKIPNGPFDHSSTTNQMRTFVKNAQKYNKLRNDKLSVITTLYGPPGFMTLQGSIRGRDLNPDSHQMLADYIVDWVDFLKKEEIPVDFVSVHNEGESWTRWPENGEAGTTQAEGHDYNLYWPPKQLVDFLPMLKNTLNNKGYTGIGVSNGEPTNWFRLAEYGYADALIQNPNALDALGLITCHGFYVGCIETGPWFGPHTPRGINILKSAKNELHSWTTSSAWDIKLKSSTESLEPKTNYISDAHFIKEIHSNIYELSVNAYIPWACMQHASHWIAPDPNPGTAIRVYDDGSYRIHKAYYLYKQVSRAGKQGMYVCKTSSMDSEVSLIAFTGDPKKYRDAFIITNTGKSEKRLEVEITGQQDPRFEAYRTTAGEVIDTTAEMKDSKLEGENYKSIGEFVWKDSKLILEVPPNSVTTFFRLNNTN